MYFKRDEMITHAELVTRFRARRCFIYSMFAASTSWLICGRVTEVTHSVKTPWDARKRNIHDFLSKRNIHPLLPCYGTRQSEDTNVGYSSVRPTDQDTCSA